MIHAGQAFDLTARLALAGEANIAPSSHNIQPARFRFGDDGGVTVLEETKRRFRVGDTGADVWKSLGAASEGLAIALSARGFAVNVVWNEPAAGAASPRAIARVTVAGDAAPDKLRSFVPQRATWRGAFAARDPASSKGLDALRGAGDLHLVEARNDIDDIATVFDKANLAALRDTAYRLEARSWMRLSRLNKDWGRDGVNARALGMSQFDAAGADIVLGKRMFRMLDSIGAAGPLIGEAAKVRSAAAIGLFHRPGDEHPFDRGRRFYRLWLEITAAGLVCCPMSVLADTPKVAAALKQQFGIDEGRTLVTAFRIGRRPEKARQARRARLPASKLLV